MKAKEVNPEKWLRDKNYPIRVLYDDGTYSVIWGKYENNKSLGVRWSGANGVGYPSQGGHPTWYVEPDFIAVAILQRLLTLAIDKNEKEFLNNIIFALSELLNKIR